MGERIIKRTLIQETFVLFSVVFYVIEHSTAKSIDVDLNLAPEWKREITQRASDYGKSDTYVFNSIKLSIFVHLRILLKGNLAFKADKRLITVQT